jgi:hypothetical protein
MLWLSCQNVQNNSHILLKRAKTNVVPIIFNDVLYHVSATLANSYRLLNTNLHSNVSRVKIAELLDYYSIEIGIRNIDANKSTYSRILFWSRVDRRFYLEMFEYTIITLVV